ncbi:multifunctional 2',3'-cyclic-nucleotide 2'-phosphodiesterase/5'-nucleotidase/3'-nucleotidase [Bosea sp. Root381]|uniref:bifunctional metallophosphatase/5'-nucleotidase n=1 Tax=Bosea sp. Root381 TaxID=1736524 RepID=UPI0006FC4C38|nr:bifunctional UDP-sugar hydrolase/5'-nucleotidase [Bosea sp. Root381]KRE15712.1 multifunctional 2',3'-cyclic-nucleotide 2'-phosphodiesterase/5'-nucleotidase/3'-nucleotidase [Bosea sp. Root381]
MSELTRRKALGVIAAPAALAATAPAAIAQQPAPAFTLLLLNDIYKMSDDKGRGGFARAAGIAMAERARGVPVLFCHAGDCYSPSLMSGFDQGAHIVAMQNKMGIDVFVPGNHEFDFGKDNYLKLVAAQTYPTFAANLRDAAGQPLAGHKDSQLFELGGIKVGVIGTAYDPTPQISFPGDLKFSSTMEALRREAKALKAQGADILVAVVHADRAMDNEIVRSRVVDILLTGHDHDLAIAYDGKVVMVESNEEGNYVTAIDIAVSIRGEGAARQVSWTPAFRVNDSRSATPDPEVAALVKGYEAELSKELDVDVATLAVPLDSRTGVIRTQEAAIGNLIADAIRSATGAKLAITNAGGIRANKQYPAGHKMTRRDVLSELPFGNATVMVEITGKDVKDAIENGLSPAPQGSGRFPVISGMTVEADLKQPAGSRVTSIKVDGAEIAPTDRFTVASNNFMLEGGDGYTALARGKTLIGLTDGKLMANEVMVYLRRLGTVDAKVEGRLVLR